LRLNAGLRWLHVYTSMVSLLVVLFFSLTGIAMNHPEWTFGTSEARSTVTGTLPAGWQSSSGVNWLEVVEYLRATDGVHGSAGEYTSYVTSASVRFSAPGYSADALINRTTGTYSVSTTQQGWLAVMSEFHRGRDSGSAWAWVIDFSGIFLTVISATGLGLLFYLKRTRNAALVTAGAGGAVMIVLMVLASR
jgi:hypothetical protein